MKAIITLPPDIFSTDGLTLPETTTKDSWLDIHKAIIICKKTSSKWLSQSRSWASDRWGIDFVAESEVQLELSLGLPQPEEKPSLNPADRSKALVTIEGISQSFALWHRKMHTEIEQWDAPKLKRALELLEPVETQARQLRELLASKPPLCQ